MSSAATHGVTKILISITKVKKATENHFSISALNPMKCTTVLLLYNCGVNWVISNDTPSLLLLRSQVSPAALKGWQSENVFEGESRREEREERGVESWCCWGVHGCRELSCNWFNLHFGKFIKFHFNSFQSSPKLHCNEFDFDFKNFISFSWLWETLFQRFSVTILSWYSSFMISSYLYIHVKTFRAHIKLNQNSDERNPARFYRPQFPK